MERLGMGKLRRSSELPKSPWAILQVIFLFKKSNKPKKRKI